MGNRWIIGYGTWLPFYGSFGPSADFQDGIWTILEPPKGPSQSLRHFLGGLGEVLGVLDLVRVVMMSGPHGTPNKLQVPSYRRLLRLFLFFTIK